MTRHLLTLDSLGRDGILVNLELATRLKAIKGMAQDALAGGRVSLYLDLPVGVSSDASVRMSCSSAEARPSPTRPESCPAT